MSIKCFQTSTVLISQSQHNNSKKNVKNWIQQQQINHSSGGFRRNQDYLVSKNISKIGIEPRRTSLYVQKTEVIEENWQSLPTDLNEVPIQSLAQCCMKGDNKDCLNQTLNELLDDLDNFSECLKANKQSLLKKKLINIIKNFQLFAPQSKILADIVKTYMFKTFQCEQRYEKLCPGTHKLMERLRILLQVGDIKDQFNKFQEKYKQKDRQYLKKYFLKQFKLQNNLKCQRDDPYYFPQANIVCPGCITYLKKNAIMFSQKDQRMPVSYLSSIENLQSVEGQFLKKICSFLNCNGGIIYFDAVQANQNHFSLGSLIDQKQKTKITIQINKIISQNIYPKLDLQMIKVEFVPITKISHQSQEKGCFVEKISDIPIFKQGQYMTRVKICWNQGQKTQNEDKIYFVNSQQEMKCFFYENGVSKLLLTKQILSLQRRKLKNSHIKQFQFVTHTCQPPQRGCRIDDLSKHYFCNQWYHIYRLFQEQSQQNEGSQRNCFSQSRQYQSEEDQQFAIFYGQILLTYVEFEPNAFIMNGIQQANRSNDETYRYQ